MKPRLGGWSRAAVVLVVAVALAVLWDAFQATRVRSVTLAGAPLLTLAAHTISDRTHAIDGTTTVPARVSLVSQGVVLQQTQTSAASGPFGASFSFDLRPYANSAYFFSVVADARQGPFLIHDEQSIDVVKDAEPLRATRPRSFRRELWLHVSYERLRYTAKLTFARDDPFVATLVSAGLPIGAFLQLTLPQVALPLSGAPSRGSPVQDVSLPDIVLPRTQRVIVTPRVVTVFVDGDSDSLGGESVLIGDPFVITPSSADHDAFKEIARPDLVHLLIDGYTVRHESPLPALHSANGWATWYPSPNAGPSDIECELEPALAPGLGKLRRQFTETRWARHPFDVVAEGLDAAFSLAPPLIALAILAPLAPGLAARRRLYSALIAAMLAAPLAYAVYRLMPALFDPAFEQRAPTVAAAAATIVVLAALCAVVLRRLPGGASRGTALLTVAGALGALGGAILVGRLVSPRDLLSFALGAALSILVVQSFVRLDLLHAAVAGLWPTAERWATAVGIVIVVSLVLSAPVNAVDHRQWFGVFNIVLGSEFGAARLAAVALVVTVLFAGLQSVNAALRASSPAPAAWKWQEHPLAIAALCAAYVVGVSPSIFTVPVALGLAVLSFRWIALAGSERRRELETIRTAIGNDVERKRQNFAAMRQLERIGGALGKLDDRLASGELKHDDYASVRTTLEAEQTAAAQQRTYPEIVQPADIAFGFGVDIDMWNNGVAAAKVGAVLALMLLALGAPQLLEASVTPFFTNLASIAEVLSARIAGAFLFGYFFAYLRGTMGVTKALAFAAAAVLASLPVWLLVDSRANIISQTMSLVLFFGVIGAWFDAHGWRTVVGRTTMPEVFALAGFGNFAALGTFAVSTLATVVTGQVQKIFPLLLKAVVPELDIPVQ